MNTRPMSEAKRIMRLRLNEAEEHASCYSVLGPCAVICDKCKESNRASAERWINAELDKARLLLESYGYVVFEGPHRG
jgi:Leu/Phe-tRNA-protein transferase